MASLARTAADYRQVFCELLRTGKLPDTDFSDERFTDRAAHEGMIGFIADRIASGSHERPREGYETDTTLLRTLQADRLRLQHACARILTALRQAEIPVICMRGLAVAERYYGKQAALRPVSDIDLLLDGERMLEAKQVLWDLGYRPDPFYRNIYQRGDTTIDLHHEPLGIERIRAWTHLTPLRSADFYSHAQPGRLAGTEALLLEPSVELPYLCFHALKHSFERLTWLYDIALVANRVNAAGQWDAVRAGIRENRLERPCYYALAYVKVHFGAEVPDALLAEIRPQMGFVERSLFQRHMNHAIIPFLAERLFARMQPDLKHRIEFWRETIYPREEVRKQIVQTGCVKCNFIRKRLKQIARAAWLFLKEGGYLLTHRSIRY